MEESKPKILESSPMGGIAVPIAIVLIGALLIFGVTKMLSTDRSYKDLVREMHSKTFGNRWIAALELSKVISAGKIPEADGPWLVENLKTIYSDSNDNRTKEFIVVALGALKTKEVVAPLTIALDDKNKAVQFHALAALGNLSKEFNIPVDRVRNFLEVEDSGLKQAALLVLGTHDRGNAKLYAKRFVSSQHVGLKVAAVTILVEHRDASAEMLIKEILVNDAPSESFAGVNPNEWKAIRLNILGRLQQSPWPSFEGTLQKIILESKVPAVINESRIALNKLKN